MFSDVRFHIEPRIQDKPISDKHHERSDRRKLKLDVVFLQEWLRNSPVTAVLLCCRPLYVTVVYQGKCSNCMRVGVAVPLSGTMSRLRKAVAQETKIPAQQVPDQKSGES